MITLTESKLSNHLKIQTSKICECLENYVMQLRKVSKTKWLKVLMLCNYLKNNFMKFPRKNTTKKHVTTQSIN